MSSPSEENTRNYKVLLLQNFIVLCVFVIHPFYVKYTHLHIIEQHRIIIQCFNVGNGVHHHRWSYCALSDYKIILSIRNEYNERSVVCWHYAICINGFSKSLRVRIAVQCNKIIFYSEIKYVKQKKFTRTDNSTHKTLSNVKVCSTII